jgi:hypothetical protein
MYKLVIISGYFISLISITNRQSRQKLSNEINLIDIYRTLHPTKTNTCSYQMHMEHLPRPNLGNKTSLKILKGFASYKCITQPQ